MILSIDVQLINMCNRKCWFCPPQALNKPDRLERMSDDNIEKFINLLSELKTNKMIIDDMEITLNRYFEPTLDIDLVLHVASKIRKILPKSIISYQTNGEIFTTDMLDKTIESDVNFITMNLYDCDISNTLDYIDKVLKLNFNDIIRIDEDNFRIYVNYKENRVLIRYSREAQLIKRGEFKNRGSILLDICDTERQSKCELPKNLFTVDYDGSIYPCCDVHGSEPKHQVCKIGELDDDVFDIYNKLKTFNSFDYEPCKYCNATYSKVIDRDDLRQEDIDDYNIKTKCEV